jgi:hypothetical protein
MASLLSVGGWFAAEVRVVATLGWADRRDAIAEKAALPWMGEVGGHVEEREEHERAILQTGMRDRQTRLIDPPVAPEQEIEIERTRSASS